MNSCKLGYLAFSKASWMTAKIEALAETTKKDLESLPNTTVLFDGISTTEQEASDRARQFALAGVDAVVMHFVTFPVGAMIPAVASELDCPFLLVANPEEPAANTVWEQNSFCGANMAAHGLRRLRKQYSFTFAAPDETAKALAVPLAALAAIKAVKSQRIGLVGGRVPGFYTSNFDELQLRRDMGTTVEVIDMWEVADTAGKLSELEIAAGRDIVKKSAACLNGIGDNEVELGAKMYMAFKKTADKYRLDSLALRCWPEWSDIFGLAPCATIGMLNDHGFVTSCEGDVTGAVTMKMLQSMAGGGLPFFMDLIKFDYNDNTAVVWHCGATPSGLCRSFKETQLRKHMRVDGGDKKGMTNEFALKSGPITLAKYDTDVDGSQRMLLASGQAIDTEPFLRGNPLQIKFDCNMKNMIDTVMDEGFEHHYALIHADVAEAVKLFAKWKGIKIVAPE